jgi:predicted  nucleic acid-binding Zn-ribbon protein
MATQTETTKKPAAPKDWQCMECGKRMTLRAAERATSEGCTKCGGSDIDLAVSR